MSSMLLCGIFDFVHLFIFRKKKTCDYIGFMAGISVTYCRQDYFLSPILHSTTISQVCSILSIRNISEVSLSFKCLRIVFDGVVLFSWNVWPTQQQSKIKISSNQIKFQFHWKKTLWSPKSYLSISKIYYILSP